MHVMFIFEDQYICMLGKRLLLICVDSHSRCSYLQCSWWYGRISHHRLGRSRVLGNVTRLISLNILLRCFTNLISTSWRFHFMNIGTVLLCNYFFPSVWSRRTTLRSLRGDLCRPKLKQHLHSRIHDHRSARLDIQYMEAQGKPREPNGPFDTIWFCETHLRYSEITINVWLLIIYQEPSTYSKLSCWSVEKKHNSFAKDCAGNNSSRRCWTWMVGALRTEMLFLDGRKSGDIK